VRTPTAVYDLTVDVYQQVGSDAAICDAARVSTLGAGRKDVDEDADAKLVGYLMANRHGSPFEHGSITFRCHAPWFCWWDHVRHRIGISYNIESSRYRELEPVFYLPCVARTQRGKPGHYVMDAGTDEQTVALQNALVESYRTAWMSYQQALAAGVSREMAMIALPMGLMVTGYTTFNPRSLMNFLSLRRSEHARAEMAQWADQYAAAFDRHWPATAAAFEANGRIAP
jgi:thymidylate synthase (FAD)